MTLSRELTQELKKSHLSSAEKVFADLLTIGYKPKDAFCLSGLWDEKARQTDNERMMRETMNNNRFFRDYITEKGTPEKKVPTEIVKSDPTIPEIKPKDLFVGTRKLRDKDSVIEELEELLPSLEGKDKADVVMKIADLQQMKKEKVKDEVLLVHYYIPIQCYNCSLRMKAEQEENKKGNGN